MIGVSAVKIPFQGERQWYNRLERHMYRDPQCASDDAKLQVSWQRD